MKAQPLHERHSLQKDSRGPSWSVHTNARGVVVCRPRYYALRERFDPEWYANECETRGQLKTEIMQGEAWDVPAGTPYLPLFAERIRETSAWEFTDTPEGFYLADAPAILPKLPVRVGLDGGLHRPAAIMGQYDDRRGILWTMREFRPLSPSGQPIDMQVFDFVACLRYLLGMATEEQLVREERENRWSTAGALAWIAQERRDPFYGWPMPWIKPGTDVKFKFSLMEHEAKQQNQLAPVRGLNSLRKVYGAQGIPVHTTTAGWEQREVVLDFLQREGPIDGRARAVFDPSCKTLLRGLAGGLIAAPHGSRKPYVEDRYLEDAFDAWVNMACDAGPLAHPERVRAMDVAVARERAAKAQPPDLGIPRDRQQPSHLTWAGARAAYREEF